MKKMIFAFSLLLSVLTYAADIPSENFMTLAEQETTISNIAKQMRRDHWVRGYEEVTSSDTFVTRVWLDNYLSQPGMFATFFDESEIEEIEKCYRKENCELYYVSVASTYMGGYGIEGSFILLFTETGKHFKIGHTVYAE